MQNVFAALLLLWQKPFRIGDQIKTQGFEGTVEEIDIRSTKIITHSGELVVLANDNIWTNPIVVNTAFDKRRVQLSVLVPGAFAADDARSLITQVLSSASGVMKLPEPMVYVPTLDSGDIKFDFTFGLNRPNRMFAARSTQWRLRLRKCLLKTPAPGRKL